MARSAALQSDSNPNLERVLPVVPDQEIALADEETCDGKLRVLRPFFRIDGNEAFRGNRYLEIAAVVLFVKPAVDEAKQNDMHSVAAARVNHFLRIGREDPADVRGYISRTCRRTAGAGGQTQRQHRRADHHSKDL